MLSFPRRRFKRPGHLIVVGSTPLARHLVEQLSKNYDETVYVITAPRKRGDKRRFDLASKVIETEAVDDQALQDAGIEEARGVAVVDQDDVGNIHIALRARGLNKQVRLVVHFFNTRLGQRVSRMLGDCVSLSDSGVAAPSFVAASMSDSMTVDHIRLPGRTLYATQRSKVRRSHPVICGLATSRPRRGRPDGGQEITLLPEVQEEADIVLAVADGRSERLATLRRRLATTFLQLRNFVNGRLRFAALLMIALLVLGTVMFAVSGQYTVWDAVYLTLLDVAGATDPNRNLDKVTKLTQIITTLVGIAIIPVVTAAVVDAVVSARLNPFGTRRTVPYHGHVVVVGLGNVGTRVIRRLHDLGIPVVCVESNDKAPGVPVARSKDLHIPVIIGDATREETLRAAAVNRCRALLAVTSDDVANLETGLQARELREELRLVLRVGDDDLAKRVQDTFDIDVSRSVAYLAAPAFAAAMINREVIATLPVGRRALLVAEVPVGPDSPLYERRIADVHEPGMVRVIALRRYGEKTLDWSPPADHVLRTDDQLVIVATRAGLGYVLASSIGEKGGIVAEEPVAAD